MPSRICRVFPAVRWSVSDIRRGLSQGLSQGIKALIKDNLEEGKDKKVILAKLEKHFSLTEKEAEA